MASRVYHPDHHKAPTRNPPRKGPTQTQSNQGNAPPESFQSVVDSVEIFASSGKNPLIRAATKGSVHRIYERSVKGYAYALEGSGGSSKMQLPRDATKGLGLVQRYLILQIEIPPEPAALAFEIALTDAKRVRRRLLFSTAFQNLTISSLHAQVPLSSFIGPLRAGWTNFTIDLISFASFCFGNKSHNQNNNMICDYSSFKRLESVTMGPVCKVRKIFTMKSPPIQNLSYDDMVENDDHMNESVDIPPAHCFPDGIEPFPNTIIFDASEFMVVTKSSRTNNGMVSGVDMRQPSHIRKGGNDLTSMAAKLNARGGHKTASIKPTATTRTVSRRTDISINQHQVKGPTNQKEDVANGGSTSRPTSSTSSSRLNRPPKAHVAFGSRVTEQSPRLQHLTPTAQHDSPYRNHPTPSQASRSDLRSDSNDDESDNEFDFRQGSYHHRREQMGSSIDPPPPPPSASLTSSLYQVDDADDITARYISSLTGKISSKHKEEEVDLSASNRLPPPPLNITNRSSGHRSGETSSKKATLYSPYPPPPSSTSRHHSRDVDPLGDQLGSMPSTSSPYHISSQHPTSEHFEINSAGDDEKDEFGDAYARQSTHSSSHHQSVEAIDVGDQYGADEDYLLGQTPLGESMKFRHAVARKSNSGSGGVNHVYAQPPLSSRSRGQLQSNSKNGVIITGKGKVEGSMLKEVSSSNPWDGATPTTQSPRFTDKSPRHLAINSAGFNHSQKVEAFHDKTMSAYRSEDKEDERDFIHSEEDERQDLKLDSYYASSRYDENDKSAEHQVGSKLTVDNEDSMRPPPPRTVNNEKDAEDFLKTEWALQRSVGRRSVDSNHSHQSMRRSVDSNHSHQSMRRSVDSNHSHQSMRRSVDSNHSLHSQHVPSLPIPSALRISPESLTGGGPPSSKDRRSLQGVQGNLDPYCGDAFDPQANDVDAYLASPKDFPRPPSPIRTSQEFKEGSFDENVQSYNKNNDVHSSQRRSWRRSEDDGLKSNGRKSQDMRSSTSSIHSAKYYEEKYDGVNEEEADGYMDKRNHIGTANKSREVSLHGSFNTHDREDHITDFDRFYESNKHRVPTSWDVGDEDERRMLEPPLTRDSALDGLSPTFDGSLEQFPNDEKVNVASPTRQQTNSSSFHASTLTSSIKHSPSKRREEKGTHQKDQSSDSFSPNRPRDHGESFPFLYGSQGESVRIRGGMEGFGSLAESGGSDILAELERREKELLEMEAAFNSEEEEEDGDNDDREEEDACLMATQTDLTRQEGVLDEDEELLFRDAFGVVPSQPSVLSSEQRPLSNMRNSRDGGVADSFTTNNSYIASASDLENTMQDPLGQTYNSYNMNLVLENSSVLINSKRDDSEGKQSDVMGQNSMTGDESLELMFNPILNCYYDPKSGKFYQLKDE